MIDTIALAFPKPRATQGELEWAGWDLHTTSRNFRVYSKNPSRDLIDRAYYPTLTGYSGNARNGRWTPRIKATFSAPKLIYGNNLDELSEVQFEQVVETLRMRLLDMGVRIGAAALRNGTVSVIHYSKNFLLSEYSAQYAISELRRLNVSRRLHLTSKEYPNEGEGLSVYAKSYSLEFYDKVAEIMRDNAELLAEVEPMPEILRFEIRLKQKRKMNDLFRSLELPENPTFAEAFSRDTSRRVLRHYWDDFVAPDSSLLFAPPTTPKELLRGILRVVPEGHGALMRTALMLLSRDGQGMRELRSMLSPHISGYTWRRYAELCQETAGLLRMSDRGGWFAQVSRQLVRYEQFRIENITQTNHTMTL